MKTRLLLVTLLLLAAAPASRAAVVYSGIQNIPIPLDLAGVYLNIETGITSAVQPGDWNAAPWMNPFFGGVYIGNDALLRPIVTGADQILNLPYTTFIGAGAGYVAGESGSISHVGPAANQFQINTPGYIGYTFKSSVGGPDHYGWMNVVINNTGTGTIADWAFDDTPGTGIHAGLVGPIPEPGTALFGLALVVAAARRDRCGRV